MEGDQGMMRMKEFDLLVGSLHCSTDFEHLAIISSAQSSWIWAVDLQFALSSSDTKQHPYPYPCWAI